MGAIGDLFLRVLANTDGLQADIEKKAGPAGDKAGATLGKRMGIAAKAAIGGLIGGGFGAAFGIAARGGAELDRVTQQLIADTGLTGAAADQAKDQIAGLYRDNLQGFDEISAALSKVHTDLGLTGDAAGAAAKQFLKFSTATGQDAAAAVGAVDDILDSFNLSADHSQEVLDKLIVSHQKWGGSIDENETALAKLAPALTAANLGIDDGIGLLNLFQAAGVDASKAPQALATALKKVKSPEELQRLIKDISDTKDPFQRAQKAIKLFGARAGPQLAQALSQGNLGDFKVSMDEATGATDKAAAAVESGFGAQFKLILKNAGGALAQFGSNFGPLVLGFSSLLPVLGPIVTTAGTALGGLLAAAIPVGMALLPILLVGVIVAAIAFLIANPKIVGQIAEFAGSLISGIVNGLAGLAGALLDVFVQAFGAVINAVGTVIDGIVTLILSIPGRIVGLAGALLQLYVNAWATIIGTVVNFVGQVVSMILSIPGRVIAWVGQLIGQASKAGSGTLTAIVGAVAGIVASIVSIPARAVGWVAGLIGQAARAAALIASRIASGASQVVSFILSIPGRILGLVGRIGNIAQNAANALLAPFRHVDEVINNILAGITGAASRIGAAAEQIRNAAGRQAGGPVARGVPYLVGEGGPELFVPRVSGVIVPHGATATGGGGDTYITNVTVPATGLPLNVDGPSDIARGLRQLANVGYLQPRRPLKKLTSA